MTDKMQKSFSKRLMAYQQRKLQREIMENPVVGQAFVRAVQAAIKEMFERITKQNDDFLNPTPTMSEEAFGARLEKLKENVTAEEVKDYSFWGEWVKNLSFEEQKQLIERQISVSKKKKNKKGSIILQYYLNKRTRLTRLQCDNYDRIQQQKIQSIRGLLDALAQNQMGRKVMERMNPDVVFGIEKREGTEAFYLLGENAIGLNPDLFDDKGHFNKDIFYIQDIMLHEMRHSVQQQEGRFANRSSKLLKDDFILAHLLSEAEARLADVIFFDAVFKDNYSSQMSPSVARYLEPYRAVKKSVEKESKRALANVPKKEKEMFVAKAVRTEYVRQLMTAQINPEWLLGYFLEIQNRVSNKGGFWRKFTLSNRAERERILRAYDENMGIERLFQNGQQFIDETLETIRSEMKKISENKKYFHCTAKNLEKRGKRGYNRANERGKVR